MRLGAVAVEVVAGSSAEDLQFPSSNWVRTSACMATALTTMSYGEPMGWVTKMAD
jgi:hypothetical protein